jgi:hypothetical protein
MDGPGVKSQKGEFFALVQSRAILLLPFWAFMAVYRVNSAVYLHITLIYVILFETRVDSTNMELG